MGEILTYYGHATWKLETSGYTILVDPYFEHNPATDVPPERVAADFILVTHGHGDHIGDTVSIARRTGAKVVACYEICNWLSEQGVATHAQHIGGGFHHPFGYVKLTQALHGSALPDGSCGGNPAGFLVTTLDGKKLYFAGDTGLFGDMRLIGEEDLDVAILPIGDNYTMGPADALRAVKLLEPRYVIPMHYNTFEVIQQDADAWAAQVAAETSAEPVLMRSGDSWTLDA